MSEWGTAGIKEAQGVIVSGIRVWCASKSVRAGRQVVHWCAGRPGVGLGGWDWAIGNLVVFFMGKDSRRAYGPQTPKRASTVAEHLAASVAATGGAAAECYGATPIASGYC